MTSLIALGNDEFLRHYRRQFEVGRQHALFAREECKAASDAVPSYSLSGMLYQSLSSGYLLLSVPNTIVRGVFAALDESGAELPLRDGKLEAHITVFRPEELAAIGGPTKVTERGKRFAYRLGGFVVIDDPAGWPEVSRVWCLRVHSPELQALRRSYGLSSLPNEGRHDFHLTVAVRRRGVLGRNERRKGQLP